MHCLWCEQEIIPLITWNNLILPTKQTPICEECEGKLELIKGNRCQRCSRETAEPVCQDCLWWASQQSEVLTHNHSIYTYNPFMREVIVKWKYRGDYILKEIFAEPFSKIFIEKYGKQTDGVIIPIPLSEARLEERGFNQAEVLAEYLPYPLKNILFRVDGEKQSKKTRKQRISSKNPFILKETLNKPAILVDDIYTTGTTIRHAAELLRQNGCPEVSSYTLIRG